MNTLITLLAIGISGSDAPGVPRVGAEGVITGLLTTVYWAAGVLAVVAILLGGLFYILSDGNPQKITRSKDIIMYGVIGLAIALMAFVITNFIVGWFA